MVPEIGTSSLRSSEPELFLLLPSLLRHVRPSMRIYNDVTQVATWFEELRKQQMADVRQALEESEDSIGSLESKLESLKVKKRNDSRVDYDSSPTESTLPCPKSEGFKFSSKDTCKDGLSAGSFTQEAQTNWALDCQIPAAVPTEDMDSKPVGDALTYEREKFSSIDKLADALCGGKLPCMRKRRGKRKRKDCSKDTKEGSVRESEALCPADVASALLCKENSVSNSAQIAKSSAVEDQSGGSTKEGIDDIMRIFSSVAENDCASVFRQRLDSQKRGRYKKNDPMTHGFRHQKIKNSQ